MVLAQASRDYSHWLGFPYLMNGYSFTLFQRLNGYLPTLIGYGLPDSMSWLIARHFLASTCRRCCQAGQTRRCLSQLLSSPHIELITALAPFGLAPCFVAVNARSISCSRCRLESPPELSNTLNISTQVGLFQAKNKLTDPVSCPCDAAHACRSPKWLL